MEEQIQQLHGLLGLLPSTNVARSCSQLNTVLGKYTNILNYINSYNDDFKRATSVYYSDITDIRDSIQFSLYSESTREKDKAFENAKRQLATDIQSLATLVGPKFPINKEVVIEV